MGFVTDARFFCADLVVKFGLKGYDVLRPEEIRPVFFEKGYVEVCITKE